MRETVLIRIASKAIKEVAHSAVAYNTPMSWIQKNLVTKNYRIKKIQKSWCCKHHSLIDRSWFKHENWIKVSTNMIKFSKSFHQSFKKWLITEIVAWIARSWLQHTKENMKFLSKPINDWLPKLNQSSLAPSSLKLNRKSTPKSSRNGNRDKWKKQPNQASLSKSKLPKFIISHRFLRSLSNFLA